MKSMIAILLASVYGLTLHTLYIVWGDVLQIMSLSFLALVPMCVGFVTIGLGAQPSKISKMSAFWSPWLTSLAILVLTIIFGTEGAICWIMIFPFFAVLAGIGGLLARSYYIYQSKKRHNGLDGPLDDKSTWDDGGNLRTSVLLLALPLVCGAIEGDRGLRTRTCAVERTVVLEGTPTAVWPRLLRMPDILPRDTRGLLTGTVLDFPRHLYTTLDTVAVGGKRMAQYERGLLFEETIVALEPEKSMVLDIFIDPKKIPPTVLDEHVAVGGRYFHSLQDTYTLVALPGERTQVTLTGRYTLCTPINWYAEIWTNLMVGENLKGTLLVTSD